MWISTKQEGQDRTERPSRNVLLKITVLVVQNRRESGIPTVHVPRYGTAVHDIPYKFTVNSKPVDCTGFEHQHVLGIPTVRVPVHVSCVDVGSYNRDSARITIRVIGPTSPGRRAAADY